MSTLSPFNFDGMDVRAFLVDGDPWFVAKDVAEALGYSRTADAVRAHCKSSRPVGVGVSPTLDPQTVVIPERDIYRLVMRSKMPRAEAFEEWVVGDVLPSIRKTGSYESRQHVAIPQTLPEALRLAADLAEENQHLQIENQQQSLKIVSLENLFKEGMTIPQFCKGLNGVNVMAINAYLQSRNWLYNESKAGIRWRAASYARDRYLTEHQSQIAPHGQEPFTKFTPVLLKKGAARLHELYLAGELPMKDSWDGTFTHDKAARSAA